MSWRSEAGCWRAQDDRHGLQEAPARRPYAKFDAGECIASKNLAAVVDPHPANCEKVTQLDGLMPRFESAVQDADREQQERVNAALRQLQGQPVPTFPAPTFTDCEPKLFGGGFFCHSF